MQPRNSDRDRRKTSHAACSRPRLKMLIVGCEKLEIDYTKKCSRRTALPLKEGEFITLDGSSGNVYKGELKLVAPKLPESSDDHEMGRRVRTVGRTNADTPTTRLMQESWEPRE